MDILYLFSSDISGSPTPGMNAGCTREVCTANEEEIVLPLYTIAYSRKIENIKEYRVPVFHRINPNQPHSIFLYTVDKEYFCN